MTIEISKEGRIPVKAGGVGLFFEDINYGLDGGLYAELIENRNFEAKDASGVKKDKFVVVDDGYYAWEGYPADGGVALKVKTDRPLFHENPHYMRLTCTKPLTGMKNKAYDGIYLKAKTEYKCSFYARSYDYKGGVRVGVYQNGVPAFEKKVKLKADGKWHRYAFRFKAKADTEKADFCITLIKTGAIHLDAFSLMPTNAILGVFRRDLVELLKELKPGFLRFPGGCIVEGNGLQNRYLWKDSIGQVERRKHNWNRWAVHDADKATGNRTPYSHYGQTLGVGYYEYFRLAEYLGAKPLPVVNVGLACQYMSSQSVPVDSAEFETYLQEALDVVEFANGSADTVWGRVRADMGHPEPFNLEYLGIGNEQWEEEGKDGKAGSEFYRRFELFEKRLHERYPKLKIVGSIGPDVGTATYESAWKWTREKLKENPDFVYCSDEHTYVPPQWLYDNVNLYDSYPRDGLVYVGEYACHVPGAGDAEPPRANLWEAALAEAAFMTGMERNADVVVMKSYAPLFARLGYTQWSPDLIWFDGKTAYGSASYYVQKLYSLYTGEYSLKVKTDAEQIYASATERDAFTYVKVVNAGGEAMDTEVKGEHDFGALTRVIRMGGELTDYNTAEEPLKVSPADVAPTAARSLTLEPHSFYVLVFKK